MIARLGPRLDTQPDLNQLVDVTSIEGKLWYDIKTKWSKLESKQSVLVPHESTNLVYRVSPKSKNGRDLQLIAMEGDQRTDRLA